MDWPTRRVSPDHFTREARQIGRIPFQSIQVNNPATYIDAWDCVDQNCQNALDMATLRNHISKVPALRIIKSIPIEQGRVFADPAQIDLHYATLEAVITGRPAALVINLDEAVHQT
jgi:hypothetical protein